MNCKNGHSSGWFCDAWVFIDKGGKASVGHSLKDNFSALVMKCNFPDCGDEQVFEYRVVLQEVKKITGNQTSEKGQ